MCFVSIRGSSLVLTLRSTNSHETHETIAVLTQDVTDEFPTERGNDVLGRLSFADAFSL